MTGVKSLFTRDNAKGTGSAMSVEVCNATFCREGYIRLEFANQATLARRDGTTATFDIENAISFNLRRDEIAQLIEVFRGIEENIGYGHGLFHANSEKAYIFKASHILDPKPGYMLSVSEQRKGETDFRSVAYFLTPTEALALMLGLEHAMYYIMFR